MDKDRLREEIQEIGFILDSEQIDAILSLILKQRKEAAEGVVEAAEKLRRKRCERTVHFSDNSCCDAFSTFNWHLDRVLEAVRHAASQEGEVLSTAQANVEMHDRTEV